MRAHPSPARQPLPKLTWRKQSIWRWQRFENDRTISFVPPDGEFDLLSYRLSTQVKPLIWVEVVNESPSK